MLTGLVVVSLLAVAAMVMLVKTTDPGSLPSEAPPATAPIGTPAALAPPVTTAPVTTAPASPAASAPVSTPASTPPPTAPQAVTAPQPPALSGRDTNAGVTAKLAMRLLATEPALTSGAASLADAVRAATSRTGELVASASALPEAIRPSAVTAVLSAWAATGSGPGEGYGLTIGVTFPGQRCTLLIPAPEDATLDRFVPVPFADDVAAASAVFCSTTAP